MQEVGTDEDGPPRRRWGRIAFVVGLAVFVGAWGYAFWYETHRPSPEPLDATSMQAATAACRSALVSVSGLTPLPKTPTPSERSTRVHEEDAVFTDLVTHLDEIHPTDHSGATALTDFAADWRHLTAARETYANAILTSQKAPKLFIPVAPTGEPITIRMGEYADIHKLDDCTPDSLQGEIVEGPRTYPRVH